MSGGLAAFAAVNKQELLEQYEQAVRSYFLTGLPEHALVPQPPEPLAQYRQIRRELGHPAHEIADRLQDIREAAIMGLVQAAYARARNHDQTFSERVNLAKRIRDTKISQFPFTRDCKLVDQVQKQCELIYQQPAGKGTNVVLSTKR